MRNISLLFICLFSFISFFASAQKETIIFGVVRDPDANEKLPGVTVSIDDKDGAITDMDGKFRINVEPGPHKLRFTFIGYEATSKSVNVKEGELKQLNVNLIMKNNELNTVVVSSSQHEKKLAQETVSMDVLGKELAKNTNSRDLGDVLGKDPGVTIQDGQISIRGGSSYSYGVGSRTAVLVDGQSYASADLGDAQLKFAPVENTEQVEVIKGASSVIYGSSALDGVVNLVTAWPKGDKPQTDLTFYTGIYTKPVSDSLIWWDARQPGYMGMFFTHKQKIGNLQLVAGGNIDYVQNFIQDADQFRARVNFKTKYTVKKNPAFSFGIDGNVMKETSGRVFLTQSLLPDSSGYLNSKGSEDRYIHSDFTPHFTYQGDNGHRYEFSFNYLNVYRTGNGDDINASSNAMSMTNQYQYSWKKMLVITAGVPFNFGVSKSNLYPGKRLNYSTAVYGQAEFNYKRLSLVAGIRYEINKVDTFFETTKPVFRSGFNYRFGKATFLRASWGQGYRLPSIGERFVTAEFTQGIYIIPNPALQPERSWNLELGLKQGIRIRNWNAFFDFATFWNEYDQYVEYVFQTVKNDDGTGHPLVPLEPGANVTGLRAQNVNKARIFGWEASIMGTGNIGPVKINLLAGYTYTYPGNLDTDSSQRDIGTFFKNAFQLFATKIDPNDNNNANKILLLRSRHLFRGDIEISYKRFSFGTTLYYNAFPENFPQVDRVAFYVLSGGQAKFNKFLTQHTNGDFIADVRVGIQLIPDRLKMILMCKNVGNRFYYQRPGYPEPPRTAIVQFNVTL